MPVDFANLSLRYRRPGSIRRPDKSLRHEPEADITTARSPEGDRESPSATGGADKTQAHSHFVTSADVVERKKGDAKEIAKDYIGMCYSAVKWQPTVEPAVPPIQPDDIAVLVEQATKLLSKDSMLVEMAAPCYIVGDIHGQFNDLLAIFRRLGVPPHHNYVFLGDYVDRGLMGLDCLLLLLAYKVRYRRSIHLLRGNHECARINKTYGFYEELLTRFGRDKGRQLWTQINQLFDHLPTFGLVGGRILCMHGGLSPNIQSLDALRQHAKPVKNPISGVINDSLWSDPMLEKKGWMPSTRGCSFAFGEDVVLSECQRLNIDLIVRAHQVCLEGYAFFADKRLITIFSAPNYCGTTANAGAVLQVKKELQCQLHIFVPETEGNKERRITRRISVSERPKPATAEDLAAITKARERSTAMKTVRRK